MTNNNNAQANNPNNPNDSTNKNKQATKEATTTGGTLGQIGTQKGNNVQAVTASKKQQQQQQQNAKPQKETRKLLSLTEIKDQEKAQQLAYYLNLANPVFQKVENVQAIRDQNGKPKEVKVTQNVLTGYEYYNVDGKSLQEWITENIGPEYELDTKTNKVINKKEQKEE